MKNINEKQIPLLEIKHINCYRLGYHNVCINSPIYNPTDIIAPDEVFAFIGDIVLNNIIPQRYMVSTYGRIYDRVFGRYLSVFTNSNVLVDGTPKPYYKVQLMYYKSWNETGFAKIYVHRIVMLTFNYIPGAENPKLSKLEVNHENSITTDNRLVNLSWVNRSQNMHHAYNNGARYKTSKFVDVNLPTSDPNQPIRLVCSMMENNYTNAEIAKELGINKNRISNIRRGKSFVEYSKQYNIPLHPINKETEEKVIQICNYIINGYNDYEIANMVNVNKNIIRNIRCRRTYKDITSNFIW